jgi:hypothetical protein
VPLPWYLGPLPTSHHPNAPQPLLTRIRAKLDAYYHSLPALSFRKGAEVHSRCAYHFHEASLPARITLSAAMLEYQTNAALSEHTAPSLEAFDEATRALTQLDEMLPARMKQAACNGVLERLHQAFCEHGLVAVDNGDARVPDTSDAPTEDTCALAPAFHDRAFTPGGPNSPPHVTSAPFGSDHTLPLLASGMSDAATSPCAIVSHKEGLLNYVLLAGEAEFPGSLTRKAAQTIQASSCALERSDESSGEPDSDAESDSLSSESRFASPMEDSDAPSERQPLNANPLIAGSGVVDSPRWTAQGISPAGPAGTQPSLDETLLPLLTSMEQTAHTGDTRVHTQNLSVLGELLFWKGLRVVDSSSRCTIIPLAHSDKPTTRSHDLLSDQAQRDLRAFATPALLDWLVVEVRRTAVYPPWRSDATIGDLPHLSYREAAAMLIASASPIHASAGIWAWTRAEMRYEYASVQVQTSHAIPGLRLCEHTRLNLDHHHRHFHDAEGLGRHRMEHVPLSFSHSSAQCFDSSFIFDPLECMPVSAVSLPLETLPIDPSTLTVPRGQRLVVSPFALPDGRTVTQIDAVHEALLLDPDNSNALCMQAQLTLEEGLGSAAVEERIIALLERAAAVHRIRAPGIPFDNVSLALMAARRGCSITLDQQPKDRVQLLLDAARGGGSWRALLDLAEHMNRALLTRLPAGLGSASTSHTRESLLLCAQAQSPTQGCVLLGLARLKKQITLPGESKALGPCELLAKAIVEDSSVRGCALPLLAAEMRSQGLHAVTYGGFTFSLRVCLSDAFLFPPIAASLFLLVAECLAPDEELVLPNGRTLSARVSLEAAVRLDPLNQRGVTALCARLQPGEQVHLPDGRVLSAHVVTEPLD